MQWNWLPEVSSKLSHPFPICSSGVMETNLPNEMHFVRQTMLKHDAIFKEQVRELHRVYKVQVLLMDELNKRGTDPPACSSTSGGGCSLQPSSAPTTEFSTRQDLYIGARSPSPGSFSCENNGIDKKEREESFAIKQVLPQPKLPARRRSFDLERPAEEYMDDDLGQEEEDRKEVVAPSIFHLVTSCNASLEPREKDKIEQGPNQQNREIELNHLRLFKKPTEETLQLPYDSSKLAQGLLRPTPSNQTFLGGIWGLSSEKCMDKTMASQMGINSNDTNASRKSPKVSFELDMSDPPDYKAMKIDGNSRIQYYSPHDVGEEKSQANQRTAKVSTPDDRWDTTFFDRPGSKAQQVLLSKSAIAAAYETQKPMQRCNETLQEGMQGTNPFFNSISQGQAASFVTLPGLGMQPRVSNGLSSLPMQGMVLPSMNVGRGPFPDSWWKTQGNYSQLQQLQSQYQQFSVMQPGNVQVTWQTPNHVTTGGAYHTGAVFTLPSGASSIGYMDMGGARVRDEWGRGNGGPHFSSFSSPTPPKPPFKKPPKLVLDGNTMELKLAAAEREAQATKSTQKFSSRILGEEQSRLEQTALQSKPQDIFLSLQPGQIEAGEARKEANMFPLNEKSLHAENTGGIKKMDPVESNMGDALMRSNSIRLVGNSSDLCFTQRTEVPQEHEISCNIPGGQIVQAEERKVFQAASTENNDQIRQNARLDEDVDFEDKEICREVKIDHDKTCQDGNIADSNGNHSSVRQRHNDHDVINLYASEPTCATETRDRNDIPHPDEDCGCQCGGRSPCQCVLDGKSKIKATAEVHIQSKMQKRESNEMQLEASLGKRLSGPIDHASTGSGLSAQKDIMLVSQIEVESNARDDSPCIWKSTSKSGLGIDKLMPSVDHIVKSEEKKVSKRSRADASPLKGSADKGKVSRTNLEVNGVTNRCKIDGKSATTNGGGPKISPSKTSFSRSSKKADMPDDSSLDTDESANLAAAILVSLAPKANSQSSSMPAARSLRMISKSMFSKDDGGGKGSGASIEAHGDMELRSLSRGKLLVAVQTETLIRPTKESVKFTVTLKRDVDKARDHEHRASDHKKLLTKRKHCGLASRKKKSKCDQADEASVLSMANEDMKSMQRASKLVPQNAEVSDHSTASEWEATDQATSQGSKSGEDCEKPLKNLTILSRQKQFTLQDEIPAIKWGDTTRKRRMRRVKKQPCQPALKQQKLLSLKSSR